MFTSSSWGTKKPRCKPPQKYYSWTSSTRNQEAGKKKACAYWELNKNHTICKNPSTKNHNSQHAILILPTQRESRQDSRPFKSQKKKKNSTLWYGSISNTPSNCRVGFQKATGLKQFNFYCSHQKSSCPVSLLFFDSQGRIKQGVLMASILVILGCKTRELHDSSFQFPAKETCDGKSTQSDWIT